MTIDRDTREACVQDVRQWFVGTTSAGACIDAVLSTLTEHGYTVAKLEQMQMVRVVRTKRDFQTTPPSPTMIRDAAERLFRIVDVPEGDA